MSFEIDVSISNQENLKGQLSSSSDENQWSKMIAGNEAAFISIFDKYIKLLFKYGMKVVPDEEFVKDTIQELFIDIWRRKTTLSATTSVKFYLFTALRRRLLKTVSKHITKSTYADIPVEFLGEYEGSYESVLITEQIQKEKKDKLMFELDKLTPRQKEAVHLRYLEEMEYEEVAEIMSVSVQSVYNLITQSINIIKHNLANVTPFIFAIVLI